MLRMSSLFLVAAIAAASQAFAEEPAAATTRPVTQADVGRFLRDKDGDPIGSLQAIFGSEAVVWYGFVNTPGNHLAKVPLSAITVTNGRLVLDDDATSSVAGR